MTDGKLRTRTNQTIVGYIVVIDIWGITFGWKNVYDVKNDICIKFGKSTWQLEMKVGQILEYTEVEGNTHSG